MKTNKIWSHLHVLIYLCFVFAQGFTDRIGFRRGLRLRHHRERRSRSYSHCLGDNEHDDDRTRGAHIVRNSSFKQTYKLGYKILLVCIAKGNPLPRIVWFKDGIELKSKPNTHFYEKVLFKNCMKSKIEIDPATIGDQGTYSCAANNPYAYEAKHFKMEYLY